MDELLEGATYLAAVQREVSVNEADVAIIRKGKCKVGEDDDVWQ